mmetsp:Transcript_14749/g.35613  ORF Transcript_14749/g.35613 Transcript_14749/m.35613 type:complete len:207 (+) Transcript_14749:224-844(+)
MLICFTGSAAAMISWITLWLRGRGRSEPLSSFSGSAAAGESAVTRCITWLALSWARERTALPCCCSCTHVGGVAPWRARASISSRRSAQRWYLSVRFGLASAMAAAPIAAENPPSSPTGERRVVSIRVMRNGTSSLVSCNRVISLLNPGAAPARITSPCTWEKMRREGGGAGMKSACETSTRHAYCTATCFRKDQRWALDGICART